MEQGEKRDAPCCAMMRPMTFEDDREMAVALGTSGVMAAMSGGVDSSVCALLLQEAGYAVRGATMVLRDDQESTCGSSRDVEDAREVCQRLGIPHDAFDLRDRFDTRGDRAAVFADEGLLAFGG